MEGFFAAQGLVALVISLVVLAIALFTFVNATLWSAESYVAAGKLTKGAWVGILGAGVALQFIPVFFLLNIAALIAALVYLVDVRPALASLTRR